MNIPYLKLRYIAFLCKLYSGIVLISFFTKVHNLLVTAQNFITRNGCSENLSTSSSNWVSLIPRTIKFVEIQPSHVEEMRFLFGTEEFVKNCKAEIHDTVSDLGG